MMKSRLMFAVIIPTKTWLPFAGNTKPNETFELTRHDLEGTSEGAGEFLVRRSIPFASSIKHHAVLPRPTRRQANLAYAGKSAANDFKASSSVA